MTTLDKLLLNTDTNDEFIRQLMSSLVLSTRASNDIPSGNITNSMLNTITVTCWMTKTFLIELIFNTESS